MDRPPIYDIIDRSNVWVMLALLFTVMYFAAVMAFAAIDFMWILFLGAMLWHGGTELKAQRETNMKNRSRMDDI